MILQEIWPVIVQLVHTPGVGLILGTIIATGVILGSGMGIAGFSGKEVGLLLLSFLVYLLLLELTRSEIFDANGREYTWLPALTVGLTFLLYFGGFMAGYLVSRRQRIMVENLTQDQLLRMVDENGNTRINA
jgi:hypothetical protein